MILKLLRRMIACSYWGNCGAKGYSDHSWVYYDGSACHRRGWSPTVRFAFLFLSVRRNAQPDCSLDSSVVFDCVCGARRICGRAACTESARFSCVLLGVIALVLSAAATVASCHTAPAWYHVIALVLVLPAAWCGGLLVQPRPVVAPC